MPTQRRYSTAITISDTIRVEIPPNPFKTNTRAAFLANSIFCPLGPTPTLGFFAVTKVEANRIPKDQPFNVTWSTSVTTSDSGAVDSITNLIFKNMYLVKTERVFQGGMGDNNALHLVELADARLIAARNSDCGSLRVNLRSYANSADFLVGTTLNGTWDNLCSALWVAAGGDNGVLGSYPGLPPGLPIDGVPNNTWLIGLNAWRALNALLDQLDCAIKHDPFSGNYDIVQLGDMQTIPDNTNTLQFDGEPITPKAVQAAAKLNIYYYFNRKNYGQERDTEVDNNWAYNGEGIIDSIATGISGAVGTLPLWDDLPILMNEADIQVNTGEQSTRTNNRKSRYAIKQSVAFKHRIHAELTDAFLPGEQIRAVVWRGWNDVQNDLGGTVTEYICGPDLVIGFKGGSNPASPSALPNTGMGWTDFQIYAPEKENYAPSDLGRHTYPVYPRLPNIVQVYRTDADVGQLVTANADGLFPGKVKRWVTGGMQTLEDCWILFVDEYDTKGGLVSSIKNKDYFGAARLSGVQTSEGSQLPIYLVRAGSSAVSPQNIIVFELYSQLVLSGEALAKVCQLNNLGLYAVTTTIVTVVDPFFDPGCWRGEVGFRGLARERSDSTTANPRYDIIWMERFALIVEAVSNNDNNGDYISAVTSFSYQQGDKDPGGTVNISDPQLMYPRSLSTAKVQGIYDDKRNRYNVVVSQQQCFLATGNLDQDSLKPTDDRAKVKNFAVSSFSPFNQLAGPFISKFTLTGTVANKHRLYADDNDLLALIWDESYNAGTGDWVIVQVEAPHIGHTLVEVFDNTKATGVLIQQPTGGLGGFVPGVPLYQSNPNSRVLDDLQASCWINFCDFEDVADFSVIVENKRVYGPAKYAGRAADGRQVYTCTAGLQEFLAKLGTDVAKGSNNIFTLYNWSDRATSGITVSGTCVFNSYTNGKWAIAERFTSGGWYINQIER